MIGASGDQATARSTQLLRGVLDLCLLAVIAERPRYGYELVETLAAHGLAMVSEGSIYPLLSRLERSGQVESYRQPSPAGPSRKYYRITTAGAAELEAGRRSWVGFAGAVARVLVPPSIPTDAQPPPPPHPVMGDAATKEVP